MGLKTLQPLAYAVAYITFFLGTVSIFLRFYCRHFVLRTRGWDDNFAILIFVRLRDLVSSNTWLTGYLAFQYWSTSCPAYVHILGMWTVR
jgi:hypothetical protein